MIVQGSPSPVLRDALAVAAQIHSIFDRHADKGTSATSCVHASLALADFLSRLGIEAEALPVAVVIRAMQDGKLVVTALLRQHAKRPGHDATEHPPTSDQKEPLSAGRRT